MQDIVKVMRADIYVKSSMNWQLLKLQLATSKCLCNVLNQLLAYCSNYN